MEFGTMDLQIMLFIITKLCENRRSEDWLFWGERGGGRKWQYISTCTV